MTKKFLLIFLVTVIGYYFFTTKGTFVIPHDLDYFNPLARSFLAGRLDIPNPIVTSDLSHFNGKWYPYWGPIPALLLLPFQIVLGRYIPAAYLSIFFAGINTVAVSLIIDRLNKEYFSKKISQFSQLLFLLFFALGTGHLFIATRSGTWFVSQTVSFAFSAAAIFILIKKHLTARDFFIASLLISTSLLDRYGQILLGVFLLMRLLENKRTFVRNFLVSMIPLAAFSLVFFIYNFLRFGHVLDMGYAYQDFSYFNFQKVAPFGIFSYRYALTNLGRIFLELPKVDFTGIIPNVKMNPLGNSIFFVSPLYLAIFLTLKKHRERLIYHCWIMFGVLLLPLVFLYNLGLVQYGIRYEPDFSLFLLILVIFGLRGKTNSLVILATLIAIIGRVYSVLFLS